MPAFVYPASAIVGRAARVAAGPHNRAVSPGALEPPAQGRDAVAREAAVDLDLRLARAPGRDPAPAPAAEAAREGVEVGPEAAQAREVVLELCQFHLQLALGGVSVVGEDVEDHRRAVDHRDAQLGLEVALLARRELVVAGDQVGVPHLDLALQLLDLALAQVAVGVGLVAALDHLPRGGNPGGAKQLLELAEIVSLALGLREHPDRQRALRGPTVLDTRSAGGSSRLGRVAAAASCHQTELRSRRAGGRRCAGRGV